MSEKSKSAVYFDEEAGVMVEIPISLGNSKVILGNAYNWKLLRPNETLPSNLKLISLKEAGVTIEKRETKV